MINTIDKSKIKISIKKILTYIPIIILMIHINTKYNIYIPCLFNKITGLYCPGCGITRMIIAIKNMNFYQAFRYNPLMFILMPFFIIYYITYYTYWIKNKRLKINNKIWYTLLIIIVLYGIIRNLPAFKYLIPTKI